MGEFDETKIATSRATWSDQVVQFRYDGRTVGQVRRSIETDDFVCVVAVERYGQTLPLVIGRANSVEIGAKTVVEAAMSRERREPA